MKQLPGDGPPPKPPPGQRGKKRHAKAVGGQDEHEWGNAPGQNNQPSWLNDEAEGRQTCRNCGIERKIGNARSINADHAGFGDDGIHMLKGTGKVVAQIYWYTDAKGRSFQTTKELGCPMLLLDEMGAIRENRQMVREVDDRVDYTDDRVDDVEERLARLEAENVAMKARLEERMDVTSMVEWLAEMVAIAAANKLATVNVQIEGRPAAALPEPVANLIIDVGALDQRERVPIHRGSDSSDDE